MQMLQPRTGFCLPNKWEALQDSEITLINYPKYMDTTFPKKLGPACLQHDPGYRVNAP